MANASPRTDKEIEQMKERIIAEWKRLPKTDLNLQAYLEGQLMMLVWFTTDKWFINCYDDVRQLLKKGCQDGHTSN